MLVHTRLQAKHAFTQSQPDAEPTAATRPGAGKASVRTGCRRREPSPQERPSKRWSQNQSELELLVASA